MNADDIELVLANRAFLFSLIARGFAEEPDAEFLSILADEHTRQEMELVDAAETAAILERFEEVRGVAAKPGAGEALAHEYVRVFVGPGRLKAAPWETVFRSGNPMLFQAGVLEVRDAYRQAGFLPVRYQHVPDDFIGIEFDFLNKMAQRALEANRAGDKQLVECTLQQSAAFEREHICSWVEGFAQEVDREYKPGFYGPFAHLAASITQRDLEVIETLTGN